MKWFRFYSEAMRDPKVQKLRPEMFKHWVNLLCLANENEPRGTLPDVRTMAFALHLRTDRCQNIVRTLTRRGLFDVTSDGLQPHNWGRRQYKSDDVTTRVKRFRNVAVTPPDNRQQNTEIREQTTEEISTPPSSTTPARSTAVAPAKPSKNTSSPSDQRLVRWIEAYTDYVGAEGLVREHGGLTVVQALQGMRRFFYAGRERQWAWKPEVKSPSGYLRWAVEEITGTGKR